MKITIISDVHNNTKNLKKVLDYCVKNEITKIICCGDLAANETLDFLNDNFNGEVFYIPGNAEYGQLIGFENISEYKKTKIFKEFGEIEVADKKVAFVHFPDVAKNLARTGKYDFVFYGHTHNPWITIVEISVKQKLKNCQLLNPGTTAGELYPPTFAVWNVENEKFELIRIHDLK